MFSAALENVDEQLSGLFSLGISIAFSQEAEKGAQIPCFRGRWEWTVPLIRVMDALQLRFLSRALKGSPCCLF